MKHREKLRLARKLRTKKEELDKVSVFLTRVWEERKEAIKRRVEKKIERIRRAKEK